MKLITNWSNATVLDLEADALLRDVTKIHVLSFQMQGKDISSIEGGDHERIKKFFQYHLDNGIPVVAHNAISYDIPMVELILGIDLSDLMVIDTLALSWYLNTERQKHGLGSFFEDYGFPKPPIEDWTGLSYEEYKFRCESDIKINKALWEDFKERLVEMYSLSKEEVDNGNVGATRSTVTERQHIDLLLGLEVNDWIDRCLTFLMFKMDCARLQEATGWDVDLELLDASIEDLNIKFEESKALLESVMPEVPKYRDKKSPAKPYNKKGELSVSGKSWEEAKTNLLVKNERGHFLSIDSGKEGYLQILHGYEPPNANSTVQIKEFLLNKGWEPSTFKIERDKKALNDWSKSKPKRGSPQKMWDLWKANRPEEKKVPQITVNGDKGKELCPSLEELAEQVPEIKLYAEYCVLKHRIGVLTGFKRDVYKGKLQARIKGFTNTLRVQHAEIVNLPGVDKPYGDVIRGVLSASEGYFLCGSDLSALEDRVKHHFMLPHDPDYVSTMMSDGYDPHISTALSANLITQAEFEDFKKGIKPEHVVKARKAGKGCNYASVYGGSPPAIARSAGVSLDEAKDLYEGYWKLNWSVKAIAEEQVVVETSRKERWLVNPVNGLCYSLRSDKDRFSTLCQGTGSYFFDMWVDNILTLQKQTFGKNTLTGSFHDEVIFNVRNSPKAKSWFEETINKSLEMVNDKFLLRRELGCGIEWGGKYSDIH